jgi:hypothetical protein
LAASVVLLALLVPLVLLVILGLQAVLVLLVRLVQVDPKESVDHLEVQEYKVRQD